MTIKKTVDAGTPMKEFQAMPKMMRMAKHVKTDNPLYLAEQVMATSAPGTYDFERLLRVARKVTNRK